MSLPQSCSACGKTESQLNGAKLSKCSRCLSAQYCGRECQTSSWSSHKVECKRIAAARAAPAPTPPEHPFDAFTPFVDSILDEVISVLQVAHFPHLYGPERRPIFFHLHFALNPEPQNARRKFNLVSARDSTVESFLNWARAVPDMEDDVVEAYAAHLNQFAARDSATLDHLSPDERNHLPASFRFACTAERTDGHFLGLRMVRGAKPYITRSGLDPANSNLAILPALQSVLEQCEELPKDEDGSRGKDGQLLSKITKAYLKVEKGRGWEDRADEAYDEVNRREPEANMALLHACIREGVNESLLLGGQHRAAYFYAVSVPEWPVKCTCGKTHGPEGHLEDEEEEEYEDENEEAGGHPGHSEGGHGGHSHSHGSQACGGHSH